MKEKIVLRTNLFVCIIIVIGFVITSMISFYSNQGIFHEDIERVSELSSEGIYHRIDSIFTKPINISLTMANDSLLNSFLNEENQRLNDPTFIDEMRTYLLTYQEKYGYDSVFLVSSTTQRYYHFNGLDRILKPGDPENDWYYAFLQSGREYALNIDNDEAANDEITVFINCKIRGSSGATIGIVGVGFVVDDIQEILREYEDQFGVKAYLIDEDGKIEISTEQTKFGGRNLFENCAYSSLKQDILSDKRNTQSFWYDFQASKGYLTTQYVPNLEWYLIIDNDTSALESKLNRQFFFGILVVIAVIASVILTITGIIRKFNQRIVDLTIAKEQAHRTIFQHATEQLYENIYEIDITHNRAASESTEQYFTSLGVPGNTPYDEALQIIAKKQIREEFQQGYIDTFTPERVLQAYKNGMESLRYDFMITADGETYFWMRIIARIFYWDDDQSIRMFVYRQNIDLEKQREKQMLDQMQKDSLSGLFNKAATQNQIRRILSQNPNQMYAFFILDIDDFKQVNDTFGHVVGDLVIADFANILKEQFGENGVIGRIGGDEFVVFQPASSVIWIQRTAESLSAALQHEFVSENIRCMITSSIGVAVSPDAGTAFETLYQNADFALYQTKKRGKNGFTFYKHT